MDIKIVEIVYSQISFTIIMLTLVLNSQVDLAIVYMQNLPKNFYKQYCHFDTQKIYDIMRIYVSNIPLISKIQNFAKDTAVLFSF